MNTNTNNLLRQRIMRRVCFIWFAKKILPYLLIELALFAGFLYLIGYHVFVSRVLQYAGQVLANNSIDPAIWGVFAWHIFFKTKLVVQLSILGSLIMTILIFKNFITSWLQLTVVKEETKLVG